MTFKLNTEKINKISWLSQRNVIGGQYNIFIRCIIKLIISLEHQNKPKQTEQVCL